MASRSRLKDLQGTMTPSQLGMRKTHSDWGSTHSRASHRRHKEQASTLTCQLQSQTSWHRHSRMRRPLMEALQIWCRSIMTILTPISCSSLRQKCVIMGQVSSESIPLGSWTRRHSRSCRMKMKLSTYLIRVALRKLAWCLDLTANSGHWTTGSLRNVTYNLLNWSTACHFTHRS